MPGKQDHSASPLVESADRRWLAKRRGWYAHSRAAETRHGGSRVVTRLVSGAKPVFMRNEAPITRSSSGHRHRPPASKAGELFRRRSGEACHADVTSDQRTRAIAALELAARQTRKRCQIWARGSASAGESAMRAGMSDPGTRSPRSKVPIGGFAAAAPR